ncbi:MAG: Eco57I restriction-modification methylase domain-containing protein [Atopobiaceae bacterium]|nr:Eco57I restriction-modification methylase domain-containing protein [Atopobiaceae bacterium]
MTTPGVVFTKDWVVDFILDIAGYVPERSLTSGCVIEPSCGDGAFLRRIAMRLCESARREGVLSVEGLRHCVRAYDLSQASVNKSRRAVCGILEHWNLTPKQSKQIANAWIREGDFLLANVPKARWVVGNPPYVRAALVPRERRELYAQRLTCCTMGSDLYVGFFEQGLNALVDGGSLCFICSDRWLQNRYGSRLRSFVSDGYSLDVHVRMHGVDAFEDDVAAYPAISLIRRGTGRPTRYIDCSPQFSWRDVGVAKEWLLTKGAALGDASSEDAALAVEGAALEGVPSALTNASAAILPSLAGSKPVPLASPELLRLLSDLDSKYPSLEEAGVKLGIGVASGCDEVYITENPELVEKDRMLPLFFMRDWRAGNHRGTKCLVNPWNDDGTLVDLDDYPRLKDYLHRNEEKIKARRVAKDHPGSWYRTLDKPDHSLMGREMLLFPDMAARSDPVYSDGTRYPHHNCYWMISSEWDVRALGGLMMSDLVEGYVDAFGVKMRGSTLRFQAQYLRRVHIPLAEEVDDETRAELGEAFVCGDRARANRASRRAYGLEGVDA